MIKKPLLFTIIGIGIVSALLSAFYFTNTPATKLFGDAITINPTSNITPFLSAGTNITFSGNGTRGSPLVINSIGGGGGSLPLQTSADPSSVIEDAAGNPILATDASGNIEIVNQGDGSIIYQFDGTANFFSGGATIDQGGNIISESYENKGSTGGFDSSGNITGRSLTFNGGQASPPLLTVAGDTGTGVALDGSGTVNILSSSNIIGAFTGSGLKLGGQLDMTNYNITSTTGPVNFGNDIALNGYAIQNASAIPVLLIDSNNNLQLNASGSYSSAFGFGSNGSVGIGTSLIANSAFNAGFVINAASSPNANDAEIYSAAGLKVFAAYQGYSAEGSGPSILLGQQTYGVTIQGPLYSQDGNYGANLALITGSSGQLEFAAGISGTYAISNSLGGSVTLQDGIVTSWSPAP